MKNSPFLTSHFPHFLLRVLAKCISLMPMLFQCTQICFGKRNCVFLFPMHVRNQHITQPLHKVPCPLPKGSQRTHMIPSELGSLTISLPPMVKAPRMFEQGMKKQSWGGNHLIIFHGLSVRHETKLFSEYE